MPVVVLLLLLHLSLTGNQPGRIGTFPSAPHRAGSQRTGHREPGAARLRGAFWPYWMYAHGCVHTLPTYLPSTLPANT